MSPGDIIQEGDRFEGPGGTLWEVVDPWMSIEEEGALVPTIWIVAEDGGDRWFPCDQFDTKVEDGDFRPVPARGDAR